MRRLLVASVVLVACSGPSTPAGYVDEYGGVEAQYRTIMESDDCNWLGECRSR